MAHVGARTGTPVQKSTFLGCLLKNLGNETKNVNCRKMQRLGNTKFKSALRVFVQLQLGFLCLSGVGETFNDSMTSYISH